MGIVSLSQHSRQIACQISNQHFHEGEMSSLSSSSCLGHFCTVSSKWIRWMIENLHRESRAHFPPFLPKSEATTSILILPTKLKDTLKKRRRKKNQLKKSLNPMGLMSKDTLGWKCVLFHLKTSAEIKVSLVCTGLVRLWEKNGIHPESFLRMRWVTYKCNKCINKCYCLQIICWFCFLQKGWEGAGLPVESVRGEVLTKDLFSPLM